MERRKLLNKKFDLKWTRWLHLDFGASLSRQVLNQKGTVLKVFRCSPLVLVLVLALVLKL